MQLYASPRAADSLQVPRSCACIFTAASHLLPHPAYVLQKALDAIVAGKPVEKTAVCAFLKKIEEVHTTHKHLKAWCARFGIAPAKRQKKAK